MGFQGLSIPERSRRDWLLAAMLCSLAILWHLAQFSFVQMNPDEGIVLQGAARILRGALPYRDFFTFYTPGSYYWTAALFRIFGESILVARASLLLAAGLVAVLTYLLARRLCGRGPATVTTFALVLIWPFRFLVLHNWDSTVLVLGGLYSLVRLLQSPQWFWAVASGALAALGLLTEQSKGAGWLLGVGAALLVLARTQGVGLRRRHWLMLAAAFLLPLLLTAGYFAAHHSLGDMIEACLWPLQHYSAANRLPYGASIFLSDAAEDLSAGGGVAYRLTLLTIQMAAILIPAVPLLIVLFAGIRLCGLIRRRSAAAGEQYFVFFGIVTAGLLVSLLATGRADLHHIVYLAPLFWFLLPGLLPADLELASLRALKPVAVWLALAGFIAFSAAAEWPAIMARETVPTRRGSIRMQVADEAIPYIQRNLPEGSKLLVHPYHPLYSFLTGTESPTPYEYLQPGMHTREQFAEAAKRLAAEPAAGVLLDLSFLSRVRANWPSTPAGALAYDPVVDYVLAHYHPCKLLNPGGRGGWTLVYLTRQGTPCPEQ